VFGAEVFTRRTSAWVTGYSTGSLGLLVSVAARRGSLDACGWAV
jgi:hypothetical protein